MVDQHSTKGGLHRYESEVQMGISQSYLHPLPQSFQERQSSDSQRVLPGVRLQPQIRHPSAQWPGASKARRTVQNTFPKLLCQGDLRTQSDLGSRRLPVLPASEGSFASVAALGAKALFALGPNPKTIAFDQSLDHRPAAPAENTAAHKKTVRTC